MASSDEALLAGLAAGDRDASAEFVRRFQRRVYGLAWTIVRDRGTAEDVAQEAFVRAWRYGASYDARRGSVLTWLLTIARNVAVDRLRLRHRPVLLTPAQSFRGPPPVVTGMKTKTTYASLLALAAAALLVLSACGGGDDSGASGSASSGGPMISTETVDGVGPVLVDADGMALYAADQESGGKVLCTGSCTSIWEPLTVSGGMPTADDGVNGKLGVTTRPDGGRQVTLDGRLLYRFAEDEDAGTVTGNGEADSFDGKAFTWHVATPTGISTSKENSGSSDDDDGGYGY